MNLYILTVAYCMYISKYRASFVSFISRLGQHLKVEQYEGQREFH